MKTPLALIAATALLLGLAWLFAPGPDPELLAPRTDLPWQLQVNPDGSLHVFDLDIGRSTLREASAKFGPPEGVALFQHQDGRIDLEAYFGKVHFGPLKARVVVRLAADEAEKQALLKQATDRKGSPTGDWKYPLPDRLLDTLQDLVVEAISYIPGTRSLDPGFFLARFGRPAAQLKEGENARRWYYPDKGLSILIDDKGYEVLEYTRPDALQVPDQARPYP